MFVITVIEKVPETRMERGEWVRVADTGNPKDGGSVYDYAPTREVASTNSIERYEQRVETLDLQALIAVVNGLTK